MNGAHAHLIINHLPVFGMLFVVVLLVFALLRRSRELQLATLWMGLAVALCTIPVLMTGEPAAHIAGSLQGVERSDIGAHAHFAGNSFIAMEVFGALSLAGLFLTRKGRTMPGWFSAVLLVLALAVTGMMGWTSNLGGKIRHPEMEMATPPARPPGAESGRPGDTNNTIPSR